MLYYILYSNNNYELNQHERFMFFFPNKQKFSIMENIEILYFNQINV